MVIRAWLIVGAAVIAVAWLLTVLIAPQPFQGSARSHVDDYRTRGLVPEPGRLIMSTTVGHEVFEIPETDALHAREEAAAMGGMHGMAMPEMETPPQEAMPMPGASEPLPHAEAEDHGAGKDVEAKQPMTPMPMPAEADRGDHGANMASMTEHAESSATAAGDHESPSAGAHAAAPSHGEAGMTQDMSGMAMSSPQAPAHAEPGGHADGGGHGGGDGLALVDPGHAAAENARTVRIEMTEWGFTPAEVTVSAGEIVRLVVRNNGNLPHEFMLMTHAGMGAVGYRLERADWNLLEHEAIYEREVVLPGDGFEVTLKVEQPGAWMYMCMFPYHMQFGMMGTMATEGMSMDMGGMKM